MPQHLLKQLAFYGAYHTNFWNQVTPRRLSLLREPCVGEPELGGRYPVAFPPSDLYLKFNMRAQRRAFLHCEGAGGFARAQTPSQAPWVCPRR